MRDSSSVITNAVNGSAKELAMEMEVSLPRMYEILSKDSPYPKAKRLIRAIAKVNLPGVRLIRADMEAMFVDLLDESHDESTAIDLHRESFETLQSMLLNKPVAERAKHLRELIAVCQSMLTATGVDSPDKRGVAKERTLRRFA